MEAGKVLLFVGVNDDMIMRMNKNKNKDDGCIVPLNKARIK
jgi:hypothetical protein